jgi:hypothetical protein
MNHFPHASSIGHLAVRRVCFAFFTCWRALKDRLRIVCASISLVVLLCSCGPEDAYRSYIGAVGPDLYSQRTINNSALLDTYIGIICHDAGLAKSGTCLIGGPSDWALFVDQGIYDIDERCDTFLDRLYYKDQTFDPIMTQIADLRTFTAAALEATKATKMAVSIVGAAFSLSESSFRNARASLLEALDPTTVKTIVFRRQQQIKKEIYGAKIASKPQALHALRAYLRVCMPFTIEMEANALLTTLQRTGNAGASPITFDASAFRRTLPSRPDSSSTQGTIPSGSAINSPGDLSDIERTITPETHRQFARAICDTTMSASANDFGATGNPARKAIEEWESGLAATDPTDLGKVKVDGIIDTTYENQAMLALISTTNPYRCGVRPATIRSAYEAALLNSAVNRTSWQTRIVSYFKAIKASDLGKECGAEGALLTFNQALSLDQSAGFGPASRKALLAAKGCLLKSSVPPKISNNDALEPALWDRI